MKYASLLTLLLLTGCATVNRCELGARCYDSAGRESLSSVEISNTCWHFLMLPIASGDPSYPNEISSIWFRDTATIENQLKMLENAAKASGASGVSEVVTLTTDEDVFLLLYREKIHTSAVLLK